MYKKTINYTDLFGNDLEETFYFNLTMAEAMEIYGRYTTGTLDNAQFDSLVNEMKNKKDLKGMIDIIQDVILSSYGERSGDGRYFNKSKEIKEKFANSVAYAEIFELLFNDPEEMKKFAKGIVSSSKKSKVETTASVVS